MTNTQDQTTIDPTDGTTAPTTSRKRGGGLSGMLLPELQSLAGSLGIPATKMRKAELVDAITAARSGAARRAAPDRTDSPPASSPPAAASTGRRHG
ncbi:MAG: Rho termination factor N-terminal domain-containing protein, partial [Actinomycetota bacterium]|nr:Rho termination factor N-terminal domain-containing protein [Actinomycetota bacterium]